MEFKKNYIPLPKDLEEEIVTNPSDLPLDIHHEMDPVTLEFMMKNNKATKNVMSYLNKLSQDMAAGLEYTDKKRLFQKAKLEVFQIIKNAGLEGPQFNEVAREGFQRTYETFYRISSSQ